ncbi:MAG TPA: tandem-95 repeat protein, partial [Pirellulales bacterium]|nr:tandem-95 repeat protein [Pirellulales bacterium]
WQVTLINQPPTFNVLSNYSTLENNTVTASGGTPVTGSDPGPDVIRNFAFNISAGQAIENPPSPFGQLVNFTVGLSNTSVTPSTGSLFRIAPYIVGTDPNDPVANNPAYKNLALKPGDLVYALNPDVFGVTTLTVFAKDNGGTLGGGNDTSATFNVPFTVTQINDPPTMDAVAPITMLENAAAKTITLTGLTAGLNEPNQKIVSITATSDNTTLLPNPTISYASPNVSGTLTLQPNSFRSGTANITITVTDNGDKSNGGTNTLTEVVPVTVLFVNDAPSFTLIANAETINEDAGPQTVTGFATNISKGRSQDSIEQNQTLNFIVSTSDDNLFSVLPQIDPSTGTLTYTPAPNTNGSATVFVKLHDNGGTANGGVDTSALQQFNINVNFVNDAPSFTHATSVPAVNEDAGLQTFQWASNISPSSSPTPDANEASQTVNFQIVSDDNPTLFQSGPFIDANGVLTYTPAANTDGVANLMVNLHDNGGTQNGLGVDTSVAVPLQINVNFVNDPPSFQFMSGSQVVNEDSGFHAVPNFVTSISPGPGANEANQTVSFKVTPSDPTLFTPSGQPQIVVSGNTGTLEYTLAPLKATLATNPDQISIQAQDTGGIANGGVNVSPTVSFPLYVNLVEHPPTIVTPNPLSNGITVNENAADYLFGAGAGGDFSQVFNDVDIPYGDHLTLSLASNSNPNLLTATVSDTNPNDATLADATLTLHFLNNQFGKATIDLKATDSHGESVDDLINVIVNLVNHAPSFTAGGDVHVNNNAGPQTIAGWATAISAGPASENGQKLTFNATTSNPGLFLAGPTVDPATGNLTFTPNPSAFGTSSVSLTLHDDGGTSNGGQDTSAPQMFNITLNAAPVAQDESYMLSIGNSSSATTVNGVLTKASDPDGDTLTAQIVSQPSNGTVTVNPDGSFTYTKGANFAGIDSFTYQVSDGSLTSNVATVNIISYEASIVTKLYEQVLGRAPDTAGLTFWTAQIEQGKPYSIIAQGIFESNERLDPIITGYYHQFLFRDPETSGLAYWRDQVWKVYGGPEPVIAGMMSSPEFYASAGGTNTGWVQALYQRLLDRPYDTQGLNYWVNLLDQHQLTEFQVVMGFLTSKENFTNLTNTFFQEYLQRQPTPTELADYVAAFEAGASQRDIQIKIIDTNEYRNTPPPPAPGTVRLLS